MSCWRDHHAAIGLGYDLLRYMASVIFSSQDEYNEFSRFVAPLRQFRQRHTTPSLSNSLSRLGAKFRDFDFPPHPEPSGKVAVLSEIGVAVSDLARTWLMDFPADTVWDDHVTDSIVTLAWNQPWLNPHEVTEIVAIARWQDATGKQTIPRGDRWLAFQAMIDAQEIDAAYIFATGAPLTGSTLAEILT